MTFFRIEFPKKGRFRFAPVPDSARIYHGGDRASAEKRAAAIGGNVEYSHAPEGANPAMGFWSIPPAD